MCVCVCVCVYVVCVEQDSNLRLQDLEFILQTYQVYSATEKRSKENNVEVHEEEIKMVKG